MAVAKQNNWFVESSKLRDSPFVCYAIIANYNKRS